MRRRSSTNMASILRSVAIYQEMEKCSDEVEFQRLLQEDDALKIAEGQPKMRPRTLASFRDPFSWGDQTAAQLCVGKVRWKDDDYDANDAMVDWAKQSNEWQSISTPPRLNQLVIVRIEREHEFDRIVLVTYSGEKALGVRHPDEVYRPDLGDKIYEWLVFEY